MPSIECRRQRIGAWDRCFRFPGSARCTSRAVRLTPRPVPRNWPEEDVPPARTPSSRIVNAPHDLPRATSDAGEQIGIIHERHPNRIPVDRSRRVVSCRVIRNADPPTSRVPRAHRPTARTQRGVEARPEEPSGGAIPLSQPRPPVSWPRLAMHDMGAAIPGPLRTRAAGTSARAPSR